MASGRAALPGRNATPPAAPDVFLNVPYDPDFEELFLAYVCGVTGLGLVPRAALEINSSKSRLDRIFELIQTCRYSVHDLSCVQLAVGRPPTPRFNMPFELGLAVAHSRQARGGHDFRVFESRAHRIQKSLSDMNGTDPYIHKGTPAGVLNCLLDAFSRPRQPDAPILHKLYRRVKADRSVILLSAGGDSLFTRNAFDRLKVAVSAHWAGLLAHTAR